ncbi:MAG: hypothetical protein BGO49_11800 [Planctomycetales bacterium 71-10]|nr:MAG: hypothetical protein BGO49_11800 [Planctomycetales bacterium 71-10]
MRTKSRRGLLGPLVLAALAGMILSESAQAQQTGLFPLAPIKRKRVPCNQEDPVYRIYKDQYFGYHPTLWRPFPSGWGAPSPEAPDRAASFKAIPLDEPPAYMRGDEEGGEPGDEPQDDRPPAQPNGDRRNPALPTPPPEDNRSPFEMDEPGAAPRTETPPRQAPATRAEPGIPDVPADDPNRSPFDPQAGPRPAPSTPELSAPSPAPAAARTGRTRRSAEVDADQAGSPLLAMPDPGLDQPYEAPDLGRAAAAPGGHDHAKSAPRRNRLAAVMDNLGWTAVRR